jgi:hypothetical protein
LPDQTKYQPSSPAQHQRQCIASNIIFSFCHISAGDALGREGTMQTSELLWFKAGFFFTAIDR